MTSSRQRASQGQKTGNPDHKGKIATQFSKKKCLRSHPYCCILSLAIVTEFARSRDFFPERAFSLSKSQPLLPNLPGSYPEVGHFCDLTNNSINPA